MASRTGFDIAIADSDVQGINSPAERVDNTRSSGRKARPFHHSSANDHVTYPPPHHQARRAGLPRTAFRVSSS